MKKSRDRMFVLLMLLLIGLLVIGITVFCAGASSRPVLHTGVFAHMRRMRGA